VELKKQALVSLTSVIDRQGFLFEPGFFIGTWTNRDKNYTNSKELVIDRFDSGWNGLPTLCVPRDVVIKVSH
jgi:hypothetical protein